MNIGSLKERVLLKDNILKILPQNTQNKVAILVASEFEGIFKNGGIGTYYRTLSQKLIQDDWKIILILFNEEEVFMGSSHLPHISNIVSANSIEQIITLTDFHHLMLSQFPEWDWIRREGYLILFFLQALCQYFSNETYLYIEFQDFWGIGYPTIEAKESNLLKSNTVIATTIHGPHDWIFDVNNRFTVDDVTSWKWFFDVSQRERLSFEKSDMPIYLSNFLKERLKGYGWSVERAIHLPYCFPIIKQEYSKGYGSEIEEITNKIGDRVPIIFFGRLEERKGFLTFVEAIKQIKTDKIDKIFILFFGKVVALSQHDVKQYDSQMYLEKNLLGRVSYEVFPTLFSQEALNIIQNIKNPIVCLTSLEENFPNTGLEIGQLGVSLIASDTGGLRETIGLVERQECLRWFKPGNSYSLKKVLEDAITNYPEKPTVASIETLVDVNASLLSRRLTLMTNAFTKSKHSIEKDFSITIHCHLPHTSDNYNLLLDNLKQIWNPKCQIILTYKVDQNGYYDYLRKIYPELKFIQVSQSLSLGEVVHLVASQYQSNYFLNLPFYHCILTEGGIESLQKTVETSNVDVITFPLLIYSGTDPKVESPPISLLEILTSENLSEIVAVFKTDFLLEFHDQEDLKLQTYNLHLLCQAIATGKNIVNYPYPLITSSHSLRLEVEPIEFLQQLNSLYKTFSSINPNLWQHRQLQQIFSGCEKLSHLSIHSHKVAAASQKKDRNDAFLESAMEKYQKILVIEPQNTNIQQKLGRILVKQGECDRGLELYGMERVDQKLIDISPQDVLGLLVVRNELLRLPYLLNFYRSKGIKKFLVADNNSEDGTREFLAQQPDVYVWTTARSYKEAHMGIDWNEILLKKYGAGHWCLNIDADEILYYPGFESFDIPELCSRLEADEKYALPVILLDMYSDTSVRNSLYKSGEDFLDVCPYFDRKFYHYKEENSGPCGNMTYFRGGLRQRIFNTNSQDIVFTVNKVPLFKYNESVVIYAGHHWTNIPKKHIAKARGALLHFKYLHSFANYVETEVKRDEHVGGAFEYKKYQTKLQENLDLTLFDPQESIKLVSSQTLLDCGIMLTGEASHQK